MSVFKITFLNHAIISCKVVKTPDKLPAKNVCERVNGKPIYAMVEAANEEEAMIIANQLQRGAEAGEVKNSATVGSDRDGLLL